MKRTVLIVDDAAFIRMLIKDILVDHGYIVIGEAEDGFEAVDKYQELAPDLVTMDINMPEKDGITALKEIINLDKAATVIMCSAMGQQALVVESLKAGAKDFVVKPFQAKQVINAIKGVFNEVWVEWKDNQLR